ncbi:MAG: hypothetical protein ABIP74_04545 [Candidatus Saccharimonas sp.]
MQGATDWQGEIAGRLLRSGFEMNIVSPRRTDEDMASFDIESQVHWELDHMNAALKLGVLAINFEAQDLTLDYPEGRAYAQTTRWEAGGAILGQEFFGGNAKVVVRIDPLYRGGNEAYARIAARRNNIPVVTSDAEFIAQILARLPNTTRPIPS